MPTSAKTATKKAPAKKAAAKTPVAKKAASKVAAKKVATKTAVAAKKTTSGAPSPIKDTFTKALLVAHLAERAAVDVKAVMVALEDVILGSVHKKSAGEFTLSGLLKISAQAVPAKKALRQGLVHGHRALVPGQAGERSHQGAR